MGKLNGYYTRGSQQTRTLVFNVLSPPPPFRAAWTDFSLNIPWKVSFTGKYKSCQYSIQGLRQLTLGNLRQYQKLHMHQRMVSIACPGHILWNFNHSCWLDIQNPNLSFKLTCLWTFYLNKKLTYGLSKFDHHLKLFGTFWPPICKSWIYP